MISEALEKKETPDETNPSAVHCPGVYTPVLFIYVHIRTQISIRRHAQAGVYIQI